MFSRLATFVNELQFDDDEEYDEDNDVQEEERSSRNDNELEKTKEELAKY